MKQRHYNGRIDEPENPYSYQITFRATSRTSGRFASCMGLVKKFGGKKTMIEIFEKVLLPAMEEYVRPLADMARAERETKNNN